MNLNYYQQVMGNNSYQPQICLGCQRWKRQEIASDKYFYQNRKTQQKVLQFLPAWRQLHISESQLSIYRWRLKNIGRNNLVEVFQLNDPLSMHTCCSFMPSCSSLFTEYIIPPSKIHLLRYEAILSLISDWINGFHTLYQHFGYVDIEEGMLGWNSRKIGKVWVNSNFALNYPHQKVDCSNVFDYQRYVVKRIVQIILKNRPKNNDQENQLVQLLNYNFAAAKQKIKKLIQAFSEINPEKPGEKQINQAKIVIRIPKLRQRSTSKDTVFQKPHQPSPHNFGLYPKRKVTINQPSVRIQPLSPKQNPNPLKIPSKSPQSKIHSQSCLDNDLKKTVPRHEASTPETFSHKMTQFSPKTLNSQTNKDILKKKQYSEISQEYEIDLPMIQSVVTVKKEADQEDKNVIYKVQQSIIIQGME